MFNKLTFILLDAARMGLVFDEAQARNAVNECLYIGKSRDTLRGVAPYLFQFQNKTDFINWFLEKGWGDSWGVMIKTSYPFQEIQKHFRKFLIVKTEDKQELYFRFYDPRVLRIFLPTCDASQLAEFFGPIEYFLLEDEDPEFGVRFWLENRVLKTQRLKFADMAPDVVNKTSNITPTVLKETEVKETAVKQEKQEEVIPFSNFMEPSFQSAKEEAVKEEKKPRSKWNMFD